MFRWNLTLPVRCCRGVARLLAWLLLQRVKIGGREWNPLHVEAWFWGRQEPLMRQGLTFALVLHAMVVLLPLLWLDRARQQTAYGLPKGSGTPNAGGGEEQVIIRKMKKQPAKSRKKFAVNPNSSIIFYSPQINSDSKVLEMAEAETADLLGHRRQIGRQGGRRLGKGGGTQGGWPEGMEGAKVRFLRLSYRGGDWDYRTGSDADFNMLRAFAEITGFQVESRSEHSRRRPAAIPQESRPALRLRHRDQGPGAEPRRGQSAAVVLARGGRDALCRQRQRGLRRRFRAALRKACPELGWVNIPNDNVIYQQPFEFPNGAPPCSTTPATGPWA